MTVLDHALRPIILGQRAWQGSGSTALPSRWKALLNTRQAAAHHRPGWQPWSRVSAAAKGECGAMGRAQRLDLRQARRTSVCHDLSDSYLEVAPRSEASLVGIGSSPRLFLQAWFCCSRAAYDTMVLSANGSWPDMNDGGALIIGPPWNWGGDLKHFFRRAEEPSQACEYQMPDQWNLTSNQVSTRVG